MWRDGSDAASDAAGMLICWHAQEEESKGVARRTMAEKVWDWGQNEDKQFMRACDSSTSTTSMSQTARRRKTWADAL